MLSICVAFALALITSSVSAGAPYCTPQSTCWPTTQEWAALNTAVEGRLFSVSPSVDIPKCLATKLDGTLAASTAHGACMPSRGCWNEKCNISKSYDMPSYSALGIERSERTDPNC